MLPHSALTSRVLASELFCLEDPSFCLFLTLAHSVAIPLESRIVALFSGKFQLWSCSKVTRWSTWGLLAAHSERNSRNNLWFKGFPWWVRFWVLSLRWWTGCWWRQGICWVVSRVIRCPWMRVLTFLKIWDCWTGFCVCSFLSAVKTGSSCTRSWKFWRDRIWQFITQISLFRSIRAERCRRSGSFFPAPL